MKKIYLSIISIILLIFTLTIGSLAWINISNVTLVEGIFLEAGSGDLLELSLDGINYGKDLDQSIIKERLKKLEFKPITTLDNKNFYLDTYGTQRKLANPNQDYISFEIYFRITPEDNYSEDQIFKDIYLVNRTHPTYETRQKQKGTYIVSKGKNWVSDREFKLTPEITVRKNENRTYYAAPAMRIGFLTDNENKFIYDVSEKNQYGSTYGAFDYYNQKHSETLIAPTQTPDKQVTQLSKINGVTQRVDTNDSHIVTLKKENQYYIGKTTLNIWLEGWDKDALDAILNDKVVIQLEFKAAYKNKK